MKRLICVLLLSTLSLADDKPLTDFEKKALKDLPPPAIENLQWYLRADKWDKKDQYLMKGKVYIVLYPKSERFLNVFRNKSLSEKILFKISHQNTFYDADKKNMICSSFIQEKGKMVKKYLDCGLGYCRVEQQENIQEVIPLAELKINRMKSQGKECPWDLDVISVFLGNDVDPSSYFAFKYLSIDPEGSYLEVLLNGKPAYVDIRHCKEKSEILSKYCGPEDIKLSEYEREWIWMKEHQKNRDHTTLNEALNKVLPCVKKRDVDCVQKYFMTKEKLEYKDERFVKTEFTEDTFKELEACLSYDKLLPHRLATKGIRKICIFETDTPGIIFQNVTYPEALGVSINRLVEDE